VAVRSVDSEKRKVNNEKREMNYENNQIYSIFDIIWFIGTGIRL